MPLRDDFIVQLSTSQQLTAVIAAVKSATNTKPRQQAMTEALSILKDALVGKFTQQAYDNLLGLVTPSSQGDQEAADAVEAAKRLEDQRMEAVNDLLVYATLGNRRTLHRIIDKDRRLVEVAESSKDDPRVFVELYYKLHGTGIRGVDWASTAVYDEKGKCLYRQSQNELMVTALQILSQKDDVPLDIYSPRGSVLSNEVIDDKTPYAYHRPTVLPELEYFSTDLETLAKRSPNIASFFKCLSDPEALAAWIWGIYTFLYKGRQIPYITSEALHGKSMIIGGIFEELFRSAYTSQGSRDIKQANNFSASMFTGTRVATIPDNENPYIFMSEWIKSVTGGDKIRIENKGKTPYAMKLSVMPCIMSNKSPLFSRDASSTSRVIPLYMVDKPVFADVDIPAEIPAFLAYAKACFEKRGIDGQKKTKDSGRIDVITLNKRSQDYMETCIRNYEKPWLDFASKFEWHPELSITLEEIRELNIPRQKFFLENFLEWAEKYQGITWTGGPSPDGTTVEPITYHGLAEKGTVSTVSTVSNASTFPAPPKLGI